MNFEKCVSVPASLLLSVLTILLQSCSQGITGSEVGNEKTCVVMPDGKTPAAGAVVQIVPVSFVPGEAGATLYSKITDKQGVYSFEDVPPGTYNVFTRKDSLVAFKDSVAVGKDQSVDRDTLETPGSLSLFVKLQPNHSPRSVVVQVLGSTMYFSNVDSSGICMLSGLASGVYQLRLTSTISGYTPTFHTITILPENGKVGDPADSLVIELIYTGIPVVTGLSATFDQVHSVINLNWDNSDYPELLDYVIFRDDPDARTMSDEWMANVKQNSFTDSIDDLRFGDSVRTVRYWYRVALRDKSLNLGNTFGFVVASAALTPRSVRFFTDESMPFFPGVPLKVAMQPVPEIPGDSLRYFWAIGNDTGFVEVSGAETTLVIDIPADSLLPELLCRAKIVNEAGVEFVDTLLLESRLTWEKAGDVPEGAGVPFGAVAQGDSIMVFMSENPSDASSKITLWKVDRECNWLQVGDPVPFNGNCWQPLLYNGKLRVFVRDASTSEAVLFSSADGSRWDSTRISGLSIAGFTPEHEVLTVFKGKMLLVNYYPPCLQEGCESLNMPYCWSSSDGETWEPCTLLGALFPDRFDEPNRHFDAVESNGSLVIAGGWRTAYLTSPPNASYQVRIWDDFGGRAKETAMPVLGDPDIFTEYYPELVDHNGTLFVELYSKKLSGSRFELWALGKNGQWQCCSNECPATLNAKNDLPYHPLVAAFGSIISVTPAGIWKIKR